MTGQNMQLLEGKKILVTGISGKRSIGWGIASALDANGAEMAFTYQNERFEAKVRELAQDCNCRTVLPCDVQNDDEIESLFRRLEEEWGRIDGLIHSIAFANREELRESCVDRTTRGGFLLAHEVSCYSLLALAKMASPLMQDGKNASIVTLSYLGAERTVPNYNVMGIAKASLEASVRYMARDLGPFGIRVNSISAGPIRTLAAAGIAGFRDMLDHCRKTSPLRRNVTLSDVGNVAVFLCSDWSSAISGENIHVDAGFHSIAMF